MSLPYHPLSGVAFDDWVRMLWDNGGFSRENWRKALDITWRSLRATPSRRRERLEWEARVSEVEVERAPVFLVGHWRSGTTHLENLMALDPQFGHLSVIQSLHPRTFLSEGAELSASFKQTKRYMDNVRLTADSPSEEEVAMAVLAPGSFWHGYYFPKRFDHYFHEYVLFEGISAAQLEAWKCAYHRLLAKLTLHHEGKRLLLKNPPNTPRLGVLLQMFPEARFVHIRRNPYEVYVSRMAQYSTAVLAKALQPISEDEWEAKVLTYYTAMMRAHFRCRSRVPAGQYVELSFEELCKDPLASLSRIYDELSLPGFATAKPHFEAYVAEQRDYRQNTYRYDADTLHRIYSRWHETIDRWSYQAPEVEP